MYMNLYWVLSSLHVSRFALAWGYMMDGKPPRVRKIYV